MNWIEMEYFLEKIFNVSEIDALKFSVLTEDIELVKKYHQEYKKISDFVNTHDAINIFFCSMNSGNGVIIDYIFQAWKDNLFIKQYYSIYKGECHNFFRIF